MQQSGEQPLPSIHRIRFNLKTLAADASSDASSIEDCMAQRREFLIALTEDLRRGFRLPVQFKDLPRNCVVVASQFPHPRAQGRFDDTQIVYGAAQAIEFRFSNGSDGS